MAAPEFVPITKGTPVKVATDVRTGQVFKTNPGSAGAAYFYTYRVTGDAAPTLFAEFRGGKIFLKGDTEEIAANEGIDIYLWLTGSEDGEVRVDV